MVQRFLLFLLAFLLSSPAQAGSRFQVLTEDLPPMNFQENGRVQGIVTDVLLRIMEEVGEPLEREAIQVMPWPRAYKSVLEQPGTILFSLGMTEERKDQVQWVGPVLELRVGLTARKDKKIRLENIRDANRYLIGAVTDSAPSALLREGGISEDALSLLPDPVALLRKLEAGRIDLFAFNVLTAKYLMLKNGMNPQDFETVLTVKQISLYIAFHKDTDKQLIARLNQALAVLKQPFGPEGTSEFDRIVERYLGPEGL